MKSIATALLSALAASSLGGFSDRIDNHRPRGVRVEPTRDPAKLAKRQVAGRALLQRQSRREKSGFYEGQTTVANALAHRRAGRLHRRVLKDDTAKARAGNLVRLG